MTLCHSSSVQITPRYLRQIMAPVPNLVRRSLPPIARVCEESALRNLTESDGFEKIPGHPKGRADGRPLRSDDGRWTRKGDSGKRTNKESTEEAFLFSPSAFSFRFLLSTVFASVVRAQRRPRKGRPPSSSASGRPSSIGLSASYSSPYSPKDGGYLSPQGWSSKSERGFWGCEKGVKIHPPRRTRGQPRREDPAQRQRLCGPQGKEACVT